MERLHTGAVRMSAGVDRWARGAVAALLLISPARAAGAEYECFIDVEGADDLRSLRAEGRISEATLRTLLSLVDTPVDLAQAPAARLRLLPNLTEAQVEKLLARRRSGAPLALAALAEEGVLPADASAALAPFVRAAHRPRPPGRWRSRLRLRAGLLPGDRRLPSAALEGRVTREGTGLVGGAGTPRGTVAAGAALVLTRLRPGAVTGGAAGWSARAPGPRPVLAHAWLEGSVGGVPFLAGSFEVGFGRGLTFDTTGRYDPDGAEPVAPPAFARATVRACRLAALSGAPSPCGGAARFARTTDDPDWREGLRGLAVGPLPLGSVGPLHLELSLWGSMQRRDLYQYQVVDRSRCAEPECASPSVRAEGAETAGALAWSTLPDAFDESLAGLHLALRHGRHLALGVTAWAGRIAWRLPGRPDFKAWAPWPSGAGTFGALGVDGAVTLPAGRVWAEAALGPSATADAATVDAAVSDARAPAAAALLGVELQGARRHAAASLRYFGPGWANPHGSPPAAPDRVDGFRARDEVGARVRVGLRSGRWRLRARGDVWSDAGLAGPAATAALTLVRGLGATGRGWVEASGGGNQPECAAGGEAAVPAEGLDGSAGCEALGRLRLALGVSLAPRPGLRVRGRWSEAWPEGPAPPAAGRAVRDRTVRLETAGRPVPPLGVRLGVQYLDASVGDPARGETALLTSLEAGWRPAGGWRVHLRADLRVGLDRRESTTLRTPRPEVQVWAGLERNTR